MPELTRSGSARVQGGLRPDRKRGAPARRSAEVARSPDQLRVLPFREGRGDPERSLQRSGRFRGGPRSAGSAERPQGAVQAPGTRSRKVHGVELSTKGYGPSEARERPEGAVHRSVL